MPRRYRVEVTTAEAHFVDAVSEADAIAVALELAQFGFRPAYKTAVAELVAETESAAA